MKINPVNRINIVINRHANNDLYLNNKIWDIMKQNKFGGEFGRDNIVLRGMPETLLKKLDELDIKYFKK